MRIGTSDGRPGSPRHRTGRRRVRGPHLGAFVACVGMTVAAADRTHGSVKLTESFGGPGLPAGWATTNRSNPLGTGVWQHGPAVTALTSADADDHFASVNYESAGGHNTSAPVANASNWLITPLITFAPGDALTFDTSAYINQDFPDRLQVRLNTHNDGTDVGADDASVGDFD